MQLTDSDRAALQSGCCDRPFQILGPHDRGDSRWLTVFHPDLAALWAERDALARALDTLKPEHREVVVLRYYADLSLVGIAAVLEAIPLLDRY